MKRMMYIGDDVSGVEFTNQEEMIDAIKRDSAPDDDVELGDEEAIQSHYEDDFDPDEYRDLEEFEELFQFALMEMASVYASHREKKGDSWQQEIPDYLRFRFHQELEEYKAAKPNSSPEYSELIDILNVGLMLLTRLAEERKE